MRNIIICLSLLFCTISSAQELSTKNKKAINYFNAAYNHYRTYRIESAILTLKKAIDKDDEFIEAYLLLADIYDDQKMYAKEVESLERVIEIDSASNAKVFLLLGQAYFDMGEYQKALNTLSCFSDRTTNRTLNARADNIVEKSQYAIELYNNPYNVTPVNLGPNVNGPFDEYWPSLTVDEDELVFTVLVPKDNAMDMELRGVVSSYNYQEDFYMCSKLSDGTWGNRHALLPPLNSDMNEGAQTISADGNWMFFTACHREDSNGGCDIYFSKKTEAGWSPPVNIGYPVNTPFWEAQPNFSADGKTLYFVSDREGGFGAHDIWQAEIVTFKADGMPVFGNVTNMGPHINTTEQEYSPFLHPDGKTLYFSSNGWPGLGQFDIFMTRKNELNVWGAPKNLGYPINTSDVEVGLILNAKGDKAYFSSNRFEDKANGKDIYSFDVPDDFKPNPVSHLKGRVMDELTKERLEASFELKDLNDGKLVVQAHSTSYSGEFLVCLPSGKNYALNVSKKGYLFYSANFNLSDSSTVDNPYSMDVYLKPIKPGMAIVLNNIFFATDSFALLPESDVELMQLEQFLQANKTVNLEISGHTDNVGDASYNLILSQKRAKSLVDFLVEKGIEPERLAYKGYGITQPVASNDTEKGRASNRRTEIRVVE